MNADSRIGEAFWIVFCLILFCAFSTAFWQQGGWDALPRWLGGAGL